MKELFLLPTKSEVLFQPAPKQMEKRSSPFEEEKPFRDFLEQAKSAPSKPLAKHIHGRSSQVHKEETTPLPQSEEFEPKVDPEDSSTSSVATEENHAAVTPDIPPDPAPVIVVPNQQLSIPDIGNADAGKLQGEQITVGLEDTANSALLSSADLHLITSLTSETKAAEASRNVTVEKAFAQLLQSQDEPATPFQAIEGKEQAASLPNANIKPESTDKMDGDNIHLSAGGSKEIGKAIAEKMPEATGEKSPEGSFAIAQERVNGKSVVAEVGRSGETEARSSLTSETNTRLSSVQEAAKPETVQTSGPPLNSATAKPIEPARLAEAHRPEIVQQVARELEVFGKSGQTSLRIQLYPEQLGRIDVRLISKNDGVQIVIHADNASTASLLERDLNFLRESLVQAGVNLSGLTVGNGQAQTRSDLTQSEFRSPNRGGERFGNASAHSDLSEKSSVKGWRDSSSTFDYRI